MAKQREKIKRKDKYAKNFLKDLLREMWLIRRFEEQCAQSYGLRKIGGFCHLYVGQEAVCVGVVNALELEKDYLLTGYRDHGYAISCGIEPEFVMAELYGKGAGCSRAKGGSMHLFSAEKHFLGGNGIVGAHLPVAAGVALKIKYLEEKGVVVCVFGDGAIHQGIFHESLNLAKIWQLPIIFICENNQYGMGTDWRRVSSVADFSVMAASYDITGCQVNGMDVLDVFAKTTEAVERARRGEPGFLEIKTYRYKGHSMSDPANYRTREELADYKRQDPLLILRKKMLEQKVISEKEIAEIDNQVKEKVRCAEVFAADSPEPELSSLFEDVFA